MDTHSPPSTVTRHPEAAMAADMAMRWSLADSTVPSVRAAPRRRRPSGSSSTLPPKLRSSAAILKKPSIAETLDWAAALDALGVRELTPDALRQTAGFILKNSEDIAVLEQTQQADQDCHCGGHCGGHHHG